MIEQKSAVGYLLNVINKDLMTATNLITESDTLPEYMSERRAKAVSKILISDLNTIRDWDTQKIPMSTILFRRCAQLIEDLKSL